MICTCVSNPKTIQGGNHYPIHREWAIIINFGNIWNEEPRDTCDFSRYGTDIFKEYLDKDDCET